MAPNQKAGSSPFTASDGTQLDPTAATLTRALRQVESSGQYDRQGASGESGAYQWMPGQFQKNAQAANLDPSDFSPVNQDKVAYATVKKMLDTGYTQSQIASIWNSGHSDYAGRVGTNKMGVRYDVPKYVADVQAAYQQISNGYDQQQAPSTQGGGMYGMLTQPQQSQDPNNMQPISEAPQPNMIGTQHPVLNSIIDFGKSIEAPFIGLAAKPVQALASSMGQPDPYASFSQQTGAAQPSKLGVEQTLGDAAQVGSYFIPGAEGVGGFAGAVTSGVAQGAGQAMSKGGDLPTVATQGALGGILGGGTYGALKAGGNIMSSLGNTISGADTSEALQGVKTAYSQALNLNAGERSYENRTGADLAQILLDNDAPLGRYDNGTLDASKAIETLQKKLDPLNNESAAILGGTREKINLFDAAQAAKDGLEKTNLPALDRAGIAKNIDTYLNAEVQDRIQKLAQSTYDLPFDQLTQQQQAKITYDASNPLAVEADKIKSSMWNAVGKGFDRDTALNENATYQLGHSIKQAIEDAVPNSRLGEVNSERGDLIDAIRRLTKLDGSRLVKGGTMGRYFGNLTGTMIGTALGGAPGGLAGDYFGGKAADFVNDPATRIAIAKAKQGVSLAGKAPILGQAMSAVGSAGAKSAREIGLLASLLSGNVLNSAPKAPTN